MGGRGAEANGHGTFSHHVHLSALHDEPSLIAVAHPGFPIAPHAVIDLLTAALASLHGAAATGVHCCGPTDWNVVLEAGPDVLSLPVPFAAGLDPGALATFLAGGGWVAWGAVPTDAPVGDDASLLWRRLVGTWCDLVRGGCPAAPKGRGAPDKRRLGRAPAGR